MLPHTLPTCYQFATLIFIIIYIYFKNKYGSMLGASGNVLEISVKQKLYVFNKKMLNLQNILVRVADLLDDDLAVSISVSLSSLAL